MKKMLFLISIFLLTSLYTTTLSAQAVANAPQKAYLFAYATTKNNGHNGLHFAWSTDNVYWQSIGPEHSYVKSDYGPWGSQKRMLQPFLFQSADGIWHCIWSLNENDGVFAHAASPDLVTWKRQSYPEVMQGSNCLNLQINKDKTSDQYQISWVSETASGKQAFAVTTKDFKNYSATKALASSTADQRASIVVDGTAEIGTVHTVSWSVIDGLIKAQKLSAYNNSIWSELAKDDPTRFASLKPFSASISVDASKSKKISDLLIGAFFEDINYGADGGLYAELIQNRDFEYTVADKKGRDSNWNSKYAWDVTGNGATFSIDTVAPIHINNKHYAVLDINQTGASFTNKGYDGIPVKGGEKYYFSLFSKILNGKGGKLSVKLKDKNGKTIAESQLKVSASDWKKQEIILLAKETSTETYLEITPDFSGKVALDMVSLFPQNTFKGRRNGLRADLAQTLADIHPRFVRFPGGCVTHGDGLHNIYRWKNTIGPLESRIPMGNIWNYHQSMGLGYFEYFLYCEDMGAEALPVIAAGVPCQNSGTGGNGQQGGVPMEEMGQYIQDILDLIEYANGDVKTTWGKKRAETGHPKPFNLKYVGIGNEDLITDIFEERFTMIFNAIKEKHPEITVIGTAGPFCEGTDYEEGWAIGSKLNVPMLDEHYYQTPGWFIHNQDFYDKYDRSKSKVYLGEYASHVPGRHNNMETALSEALYMTSLERNGDIVSMTSYAPLFAKEKYTNWNPDLIYFNNTEVKVTPGYYVQKLYGQNAGDEYLPSTISTTETNNSARVRIGKSVVRDSRTNDIIVKLVNMLPVAVDAKINLGDISIADTNAQKTVLQGQPEDKTPTPVTSTCKVDKEFDNQLPPYSFTVIRIKTK